MEGLSVGDDKNSGGAVELEGPSPSAMGSGVPSIGSVTAMGSLSGGQVSFMGVGKQADGHVEGQPHAAGF